jgi:hypothetical protein
MGTRRSRTTEGATPVLTLVEVLDGLGFPRAALTAAEGNPVSYDERRTRGRSRPAAILPICARLP